jgi:hypothetical protein
LIEYVNQTKPTIGTFPRELSSWKAFLFGKVSGDKHKTYTELTLVPLAS